MKYETDRRLEQLKKAMEQYPEAQGSVAEAAPAEEPVADEVPNEEPVDEAAPAEESVADEAPTKDQDENTDSESVK